MRRRRGGRRLLKGGEGWELAGVFWGLGGGFGDRTGQDGREDRGVFLLLLRRRMEVDLDAAHGAEPGGFFNFRVRPFDRTRRGAALRVCGSKQSLGPSPLAHSP